uniref:Uncharacterized protein n=1 Tax=Molossus molossus TaxID=27622 RepID=A0A7J8JVN8_MOLMO|nr:hypothetical protein HJG59_007915 [Molossus molossus]
MDFHFIFAKTTHTLNTYVEVAPADLDHVKAVRPRRYILEGPRLLHFHTSVSLGGILLGRALKLLPVTEQTPGSLKELRDLVLCLDPTKEMESISRAGCYVKNGCVVECVWKPGPLQSLLSHKALLCIKSSV